MQFRGWWVSGDAETVTITRATFDDTELSEASGWTRAHQNEEAKAAHGFVTLDAALADVQRRLTGGEA